MGVLSRALVSPSRSSQTRSANAFWADPKRDVKKSPPANGGTCDALSMVMLTILVVLLILALLGGGFGYGRYGAAGLSPAAIVGVILVIMLLTGRL